MLFEQDILALALFSIESKHVTLNKSIHIPRQEFRCGDTALLQLPLLTSMINRFIATHKAQGTFAIIIQQEACLPQENIFEYQLLAHSLSLTLTHIVSTQDARKYAAETEPTHYFELPLELKGAVRLFMDDL